LPILQQQQQATQMMNQRIAVQNDSVQQTLRQQPVSLASSQKSVSVEGLDEELNHVSLPGGIAFHPVYDRIISVN
jgi:hypothetical protein